jgi:hypothetical protein
MAALAGFARRSLRRRSRSESSAPRSRTSSGSRRCMWARPATPAWYAACARAVRPRAAACARTRARTGGAPQRQAADAQGRVEEEAQRDRRAGACASPCAPVRHAAHSIPARNCQDRAVMEKKTQLKVSSTRVRCAQPTNPLPWSWCSTHIAARSTHPSLTGTMRAHSGACHCACRSDDRAVSAERVLTRRRNPLRGMCRLHAGACPRCCAPSKTTRRCTSCSTAGWRVGSMSSAQRCVSAHWAVSPIVARTRKRRRFGPHLRRDSRTHSLLDAPSSGGYVRSARSTLGLVRRGSVLRRGLCWS